MLGVAQSVNDLFRLTCQAGQDLGQEWAGLALSAFVPGAWHRTFSEVADDSIDLLQVVSPAPEGLAARRELANKAEVYRLVRHARRLLGLSSPRFDLAEAVERAYRLDSRRAMWVLEGLGHDYAQGLMAGSRRPRGILTGVELPEQSLVMLHLGLGMALAESLLARLGPHSRPAELAAILDEFLEACSENSQSEHEDAAVEALGLMTRCFFPHLVGPVDRELEARHDTEMSGYFWHGVGRAIYFLPVNFLPGHGSLRHALRMARREAPRRRAWTNAVSGVGYAAALVNLLHPEVLAYQLDGRGHADERPALVEGIRSSILVRRATAPEDTDAEVFLDRLDPVLAAAAAGGDGAVYRRLAGSFAGRQGP